MYRNKATRWESTWHLESHLGDRQEKILSEKSETCLTFSYWFILISPVPSKAGRKEKGGSGEDKGKGQGDEEEWGRERRKRRILQFLTTK